MEISKYLYKHVVLITFMIYYHRNRICYHVSKYLPIQLPADSHKKITTKINLIITCAAYGLNEKLVLFSNGHFTVFIR